MSGRCRRSRRSKKTRRCASSWSERWRRGGEARFRLLEAIRQYARGKLRASDEEAAVCDRHLEHFLRFAEEAEPHTKRAEQLVWFQRLEGEHDNLRAALDWAIRSGDSE